MCYGPRSSGTAEINFVFVQICELTAKLQEQMADYKATLVSDGRKDIAGRPLINFVDSSLVGDCFIGVDDMSGMDKTGENLAAGLAARIDAAPRDHYGLLLLDSASACVKARKLLDTDPKYFDPATGRSRYEKIVKGSCGAHTMDLFIEDVCKMDWASALATKMKRIVNAVYNADCLRDQYQNKESGRRLSKFVDTRFGTLKLVAEDLKQNRLPLGRTLQSPAWSKWAATRHSRGVGDPDADKTNAQLAQLIFSDIFSPDFWQEIDNFVSLLEDAYTILRMCDSNVPPNHEIFKRMSAAKAKLESDPSFFGRTQPEMEHVVQRFDARWELMHNTLHSVGFVLGPCNHKLNTWGGTTWTETIQYIKLIYGHNTQQTTAAQMQLLHYKRKTGPFAAAGLFEIANDLSPTAWWELHGCGAAELMHIALVALSQMGGVGAAERNWKVFTFIHDRRRNRLSKERAERLVRCHYNIRILNRVTDQEYEELIHHVYDPDEDDESEEPAPQPAPQPGPEQLAQPGPAPAVIPASQGNQRVHAIAITGPLPAGAPVIQAAVFNS